MLLNNDKNITSRGASSFICGHDNLLVIILFEQIYIYLKNVSMGAAIAENWLLGIDFT